MALSPDGLRRCSSTPLVASWALRPTRGPDQRWNGAGLSLSFLCCPAPCGQPPLPDRGPRPHQRQLPAARNAARSWRPDCLHPVDPRRSASGRPASSPTVSHQPLHPCPEPRLPGRNRSGCRPWLSVAHPVRRHRGRRGICPRNPGRGFGGGAQRDLLVQSRRIPRNERVPLATRTPHPGFILRVGPCCRGRRPGNRPAGGIRRHLPAARPRSGVGQSSRVEGLGAGPVPRSCPDHIPRGTPGPTIRRPAGRSPGARAGHRLGDGQLGSRCSLPLGLRGGLQPLHLPHRPAHRLRIGQHPGRHPGDSGRTGHRRVRVGFHDRQFRAGHGGGPVWCVGLPGHQLLAAHPLRGTRLRLPRGAASAALAKDQGVSALPQPQPQGGRPPGVGGRVNSGKFQVGHCHLGDHQFYRRDRRHLGRHRIHQRVDEGPGDDVERTDAGASPAPPAGPGSDGGDDEDPEKGPEG